MPLAVNHGLVTVSTPGPVQNTYSTEQLQVQDYWDRIIGTETTVKSVITFYITLLLPTQQWLFALDERPTAMRSILYFLLLLAISNYASGPHI